jgi:hypothetical protein
MMSDFPFLQCYPPALTAGKASCTLCWNWLESHNAVLGGLGSRGPSGSAFFCIFRGYIYREIVLLLHDLALPVSVVSASDSFEKYLSSRSSEESLGREPLSMSRTLEAIL